MALSTAQIQNAYVAFFNRPADVAGLNYWSSYAGNAADLLNTFAESVEYKDLYAGLNSTQLVNAVYQNLFGRSPDVEGLTYWVGQLDNGALKIGNFADAVSKGAQSTDADIVDNKVAAATAFTESLDTTAEIVAYASANSTALAAVKTWLNTVTSDAASVTAATGAPLTAVLGTVQNNSNENAGKAFTLTNGIDTIVGTAGNDTILAGQDNGQNALSAGDQIDGGAGTDTLKIYSGTANFAAATVKNVEIVEAYEDAALNVAANTDVKQVWSIGGAGKQIDANVGQVVGFGNQATGGASTAAFANVAGLADAATIAVKDAGKTAAYTSITVAGIETLTVQAEGTNKLGSLIAANTATLNVSGAGSLTAVAAGGTFKTIDASTNTGGVTLDISGLAPADLKVTGGSGNDEITVDSANLTKLDSIALGDGTDVLGFAVTNVDFSTAANVAALAGVTGVEGLKVNGALTLDADASLLSQSNFIINSTGVATLTNFANTDTLTLGGQTIAASTVGLELGQNTLNVTLAGSTTAAADAAAGLVVTGSSEVNVVSNGTAGVAQNVLNITTADNNAYNVTGSHDLKLTVTGAGVVTGQTVNASSFTGKLDVTGTAIADTITGGTGNDTITGGVGGDKLTGGAGADKFVIKGTVANVYTDSLAVAGSFDKITDFVAGTDKIALINTTAVTGVTVTTVNVATAADLAGLLTAIGTQVAASAGAAANVGLINVADGAMAGTYVLVNDGAAAAAATDTLIQVTGVSGTITAADFVFA